ncbi:MAG TPA: fibronectin type III domain-containing protein, partial [Dermatophilaceae bacterium]
MTTDRNSSSLPGQLLGDLVVALFMGLAGAGWLTWLAAVSDGRPHGWAALIGAVPAAVAFTLPAVLVVIPLTLRAARRNHARSARFSAQTALVCAPFAAAVISAGNQLRLTLYGQVPPGLPIITMVGDTLSLLVVLVPLAGLLLALRALPSLPAAPARSRIRVGLALGVGIATAMSTATLTPAVALGAVVEANGVCPAGAPARSYDVQSINVNMPINRFGDHDPKGRMYVLDSRVAAVRAEEATQKVSIGLRDDAIQPLIIRANEGECLTINYTNNADGGDFGVHVDGLAFDVASSGDAIGRNAASSVAKGASASYTYYVPNDKTLEGAHYLHPGPGFRDQVNHGLFGSVVVEPPGSTYLDPNFIDEAHADAAQPNGMQSGWEATIRPAGSPSFRENVQLYHEIGNEDEKDAVLQANGVPVPDSDPHTESYRPDSRAINYRSEGFFDRLNFAPTQEAHAYASYTFGDPSTPMPRGYKADPTKFRILHAGSEMFHVFHMHGGGIRWRFNPVADTTYNYADTGLNKHPVEMSDSERLDSQAFGPGESYNLEIEGGAGGVQQGAGDFLFHCHIAEHYVSGMWSFWRVYDTRQSDFAPLGDRAAAGLAPSWPVDSTQLIGRTINGQTITAANLDSWVRPQLPPPGVRKGSMDGAVWNWSTNPDDPTQYLGETEDTTTTYPDYYLNPNQPGHPTALPDDTFVGNRPVLLFNPDNGRPAYPMMRPHLGMRPPFSPNGHSGAPYLGEMGDTAPAGVTATHLDPYAGRPDAICPGTQASGAPTVLRRFNVVAVEHSVQVTPTRTDPTGMVFVLAHDKAAVLAGTKTFQPLALRTNVGECDAVTLTSELTDANAANNFSQVNIHIHHVQFDTQASDGVITGMSYEQAVRPYKVEDPQLTADAAAGDTVLALSSVAKFQVGESIGVGLGTEGPAATDTANSGQSGKGPEVRTLTAIDAAAGTVTLSAPLTEAHPAGQWAGTEFVQYRWYPDVNLDNIFFHDHVDGINTWAHGLVGQLITEPKGSTYHDPKTGALADSGTIVDIHTSNPVAAAAGVTGSFREMALWTMDKGFGPTFDSMLNLRANPLTDRVGDPSLRFSSYAYGDPLTPLPRAYVGDPFVIRAISVAPTVDTLHVDGHTFGLENRYADSSGNTEGAAIDTLHYGISEKYSLILKGGAGGINHLPGDYLYFNGIDRRIKDGAWGIIRVLKGRVTTDPADPNFLQPLPGSTPPDAPALPTQTGGAPPEAATTASPCPTAASAHTLSVTAVKVPGVVDGSIRYAYVPTASVAAVAAGTTKIEPLVLHVRQGECVSVAVTNQTGVNRISFHLAGLATDTASSGANVGWNPETSIANGATRTYTYFVDNAKVAGGSITDLGGGLNKQGLYGAYTVAPAGSQITDPSTGAATDVGACVDVHPVRKPAYRDFTLVLADDDTQIGASFMPYPIVVDKPSSVRVNYQQAPRDDSLSNAFSSAAFGDPNTPILTAYAGDPMVVHTLVAPGSEQMHSLNLGGLSFSLDPNIGNSNSVQTGGVGPWEMLTSFITGGAGGTAQSPGDYFYGDMRRVFTKAGMWGLQRVLPLPTPASCPEPGAGIQCLQSPNKAPGAPTIGSATAGDTTATVSWTPPASDGGSAVTGYLVRVVDANTNAQIGALHQAAAGATSLTVADLANGTGVALQVSATNSVGTGDPSALSATVTPTTPPTVPGAPAIGSATAGNATATLSWTAPASDGGSAITGYAIIAIDTAGNPAATAIATPTATTATVTGLTNTRSYRLQILAYNGVGTGP